MCICLYSYHSNPLQLFMLLHSCYSKKKAFLALFGLILSRIPKTFMLFRKKWSENLEGVWKVHTFASAFEQKRGAPLFGSGRERVL